MSGLKDVTDRLLQADDPTVTRSPRGWPGLTMDAQRRGHQVTVAVGGDLCLLTAPRLRGLLEEIIREAVSAGSGAGMVVTLDLSTLGFLGAAGLNVFADARDELVGIGARLELVGAGVLARRILAITGLTTLLGPPDAPGA